ncbi:MAG: hypothetical protein KatS3mg011_2394 [Acidimicrobiia bacterium]|nr:MAG: hypothetical protein KatS3mg011_2394 [Acidimicrobiia bacterium]
MEAVSKALEMIQGGGLAKVVLARDYGVWSKRRFDPHRVLGRLRDRFPECFVFLMDGLAGASPELLVRLEGTEVESVPLAGSAPRGTGSRRRRPAGPNAPLVGQGEPGAPLGRRLGGRGAGKAVWGAGA